MLSLLPLYGCLGEVQPSDPEVVACLQKPLLLGVECVTELALDQEDPGVCDGLVERPYRLDCKEEVAVFFCNRRMCASMDDLNRQQECLDVIKEAYETGECPRAR